MTSQLLTRSAHERFYHPELDVLRFSAFFLIFIHHSIPHDPAFYARLGVAPMLSAVLCALGSAGAFGVELFFLLSAYLVTELRIRERALRGQVDLKSFYIRRLLRIWPLYLFFLAFAWALQWIVPGQHIGWRAGLAFLLLAGNWWVVFVGFPSSVIFPLWFISLQEQFYLFWPATMRKLSARGMLIVSVLMLVVASLTRWYLALRHTWESRLWANTFVQLDAIALGIILAVLLAGRAPRLAPLHRAALYLGGFTCFLLAGSYFVIKGDPLTVSRVLLGYPVAAIGAVALFLATLRPQPEGDPHPLTGDPHPPAVGECGDANCARDLDRAGAPFKPSFGLGGAVDLTPGFSPLAAPRSSAHGSLVHYICHADPANFQPANITFDLLEQLDEPTKRRVRDKKLRHQLVCERALVAFDAWFQSLAALLPTR
jgi:peptidoglycan/LPS O-acetylase OafA/YrhL